MRSFIKAIKKQDGFSLIELIIVVAILVILTTMLTVSVFGYVRKAQTASAQKAAETIYIAAQSYVTVRAAENIETFTPNTTLNPQVLTASGAQLVDLPKDAQTIDIMIANDGINVDYVYYENTSGMKADYPVGRSGRIN